MTKISKRTQKKKIIAKMPKLAFKPEVTPYLRKVITEAIKDKYEGKAKETTIEEIMQFARSLE